MFNSPLKHLDFKLSPSKISKNEWISVKRWLVENTSWKKQEKKTKKVRYVLLVSKKDVSLHPKSREDIRCPLKGAVVQPG